jgi:hypothetical protein
VCNSTGNTVAIAGTAHTSALVGGPFSVTVGTAANPCASGVPPTTTGAITKNLGRYIVQLVVE